MGTPARRPYYILTPTPAFTLLASLCFNPDNVTKWDGFITVSYTEGKFDHRTEQVHGILMRADFHDWCRDHVPADTNPSTQRTSYQEGQIEGWYQSWISADKDGSTRFHSISVSWVDDFLDGGTR